MTRITRKWSEARAKCDAEGCRVCGTSQNVEAAHIIGTALDRFDLDGSPHPTKTWPVYAVRIVPLCGPFPEGCHGDYDHKRLSIEPYLTKEEAAQAVLDAGSIGLALRRISPAQLTEERVA